MRAHTVVILVILLPLLDLFLLRVLVPVMGPKVSLTWVVLALLVGLAMVRLAGASALRRLRSQLHRGELPDRRTLHDVLVMSAGILLAFPGFLTDVLAMPLLVGSTRRAIAELIISRLKRRFGLTGSDEDEGVYEVGPDGKPIRDIEVEVHTECSDHRKD